MNLTSSENELPDDSSSMGNLWYVGLILGLLGSLGINIGNNVQALALSNMEIKLAGKLSDQEDEKVDLKLSPCKNFMWVCGTTVFVLGSVINFVAFAYAPQSMLASLEGVQFVSNVLFSRFVRKAHVPTRGYVGTVLIVCGTILIVLGSEKNGILFTEEMIMATYLRTDYLIFLGVTLGLGVGSFTATKALTRANKQKTSPLTKVMEPVMYALFSALFGSQAVVQAKCLAVLIAGDGWYARWFTYVTLAVWLAFVGVWLFRMNAALGLYPAIFIIPLLQAGYIFLAIVSGGVFFKEFATFKLQSWLMFGSGLVFILYGLYLLVPKDDIEGDEEDAEHQHAESLLNLVEEEGGENDVVAIHPATMLLSGGRGSIAMHSHSLLPGSGLETGVGRASRMSPAGRGFPSRGSIMGRVSQMNLQVSQMNTTRKSQMGRASSAVTVVSKGSTVPGVDNPSPRAPRESEVVEITSALPRKAASNQVLAADSPDSPPFIPKTVNAWG